MSDKIDQKYIDKVMDIQRNIHIVTQDVPDEDKVLFICAAYNAKIAFCLKEIDDLKQQLDKMVN